MASLGWSSTDTLSTTSGGAAGYGPPTIADTTYINNGYAVTVNSTGGKFFDYRQYRRRHTFC